jgi:ubiquinone biosynthesis protein UbiJ
MAYTLTIPIALGTSKTGLTLKAQLVDTAGEDVGSAVTTGFVEVGGGQYLWTGSIPDGHRGGVKFLDNVTSEFYAATAINPEEAENTDTKVSTRATAQGVWDYGTRTLTSFGTLVADIWSHGTRTLTSFGSLVSNIWSHGNRSLTSFGTLVADIWGYADRQLTGFSQALAKQVWDVLDADIGGVGTAGERFKKLDVLVSSRSTLTATQVRQEMDSNSLVLNHILQDTDALEQRLTAGRAAKLDFITGTLALESTLAEMKGTGWTTESLKSLSDSILTRLAAAEYTAPDNAGIAAVKAQTDKLQFTAANDVKATLDGEAVTAATVQDKSGYSLAADQSGVIIGTVNNLGANAKAHVNAEVDAALNTAVPDDPVVGSINERMKTMGDAYTADRAAKLDNLTGPVALETTLTALKGSGWSTETLKAIMDTLITRMPASSYVAPDNASIAAIKAKTDGLNFVGTDVKATLDGEVVEATVSDKTGFSLAADQSGVTIGTVNSLGETAQGQVESNVNDALNAAIPAEPLEGSIFERIKALDDAYTAARAAKLDYLAGPVALEATLTAMKGVGWTDQTLVKLGEDILSRLSAAEYTDPDNASIAAIKTQTDKLRFAGNDVKATLDGEAVTAAVVNDKTGYSLAEDQSGVTVGVVNALGATARGQVNTEVDGALNAPIGDAPADGSINERIKALDDAYTATRAAKLDFITGAVALEATLAAMKGAGWTVETLKALYDQILLRLPTASYTPPDNLSIAAIKAQTDKLTFTGSDVKATLDGEKVTAQTVEDKTGYSLAADQSGVTVGTVNSLGATAQEQVNTEVDGALNAPIGDAPADGSINERIKALDDAYTAARAAKLDYLDAVVGPVVPPATGANPVTITLVDTDGAPVPGLTVTVWNDAITARLAYGTTDSNGQVVFNLESGAIKIVVTTTLAWEAVGATAYTVTDTGAQSVPNITLTAQSVTPPALANQIIGVLNTYDATGALKGNVAICIEMVKGPGTAGQSHDTTVNTHTSNASGRLEVAHLMGAEYRARRGNSDMDWVYYTAPSTGTSFSLPEILGRP